MSTAKSDELGGAVMLGAAVAALIWANSPLAESYHAVFAKVVGVGSGVWELRKSLELWISDALMAIFFLLVGLEIKREMLVGQLSSRERIALPTISALGGMALPALIFLSFNGGDAISARGWAVPCATDIAFSLAVLRLVGRHVPDSLRLFLTAVAVLDDVGSIVIIALFYTADLSVAMLVAALLPLLVLVALNRAGVASVVPYLLVGVVLWFCILKSGIHPTIAGVILASTIPLRTKRGPMLERLEERLQPWVVFLILPLFALANAGVSLAGLSPRSLLDPVALGIILGLFFGKTFGISLGVWVSGALRLGSKPEDASWMQMLGVANIAGIGFTMSLLLAALAYDPFAPHLFADAKLGVLLGSTVGAVVGIVVLLAARPRAAIA
ncbi:MAG TPA: Na+/H+ antiporter NhaA [Steroidobacteraceae bacterium]|nr:Na+/H+ antiporter NhaA [Steroidobacteraceae bacterium]